MRRHSNIKSTPIWVVLVCFSLSGPLRAADSTAASASSSASSQNATDFGTPTITPAPQPTQAPDRSDKNGAAKAIAMGASAFAMIQCMMLMKKANETEDEDKKMLYQMMAGQQCSQAAKDAQDAAKNDDNKNQLKSDSNPAQAQLTTKPFQTPTQSATAEPTPTPLATPTTGTASNDNFTLPDATATPERVDKSSLGGNASATTPTQFAGPDRTAVKPIDGVELKFDETSKGGGITPTTPNSGTLSPLAFFSQSRSPDEAKKAAASAEEALAKNRKRFNGEEDASGGAGGESEGGSAKSGGSGEEAPDPFKAMLEKMMGGADAAESAGLLSGSSDIIGLPSGNNDKAKANIFQYANYRYKTAAHTEGRLRLVAGGKRNVSSIEPVAITLPQ